MPSFQEDTLSGIRISCRPRGYDLLRCPCRCLSLLIHYVAFATVTMWAGLPEPRDCGVLSIVLCVSGLENLFPGGAPLFVAHFTLALRRVLCTSVRRPRPHYYLITLLSRLISSPVRLLTRYLLHLYYDWSLCLAQLTPAYGVTSFRFIQAATALHHQHSVALLLLLAWVRVILYCLLSFFFLVPSTVASACHSSINRLSGLRPVF